MNGEKKTNKVIVVSCIILIIIIILLMIINGINANKKAENTLNIVQEQDNEITNEFINPNLTTDLIELSNMPEKDRIQYYIDKYLFYLEEKDYKTAYSKLSDEFKEEHFPTIEKFTSYVINKYPEINTISYEEYYKLGKYYVFNIKFSDILNATDTEIPSFMQKFVVVENELNDYVMSFQAE